MDKVIEYTLYGVIVFLFLFLGMFLYFTGMFIININFEEEHKQPVEVICTWDIPAQSIGADLPPLPVRKP